MSRMLKSLIGSIVPRPSGLASDSLSSSCSALNVVLPGGLSLYKNSLKVEINTKKIIAVREATYAAAKRKPDKNQAGRNSHPGLCDTGAAL